MNETANEALARRVRYAAAHPIEGLLGKAELDAIRERSAQAVTLVEPSAEYDAWLRDAAPDRTALLRHIDALERHLPIPTLAAPKPDPWHGPPSHW